MAVPAVHANPGTAGTARGAETARSNEWLDADDRPTLIVITRVWTSESQTRLVLE